MSEFGTYRFGDRSFDDLLKTMEGGVVLWTPAELPALSLWMDFADTSNAIVVGGNITGWNDKSPSQRHASLHASATGYPIATTLNGIAALDLDDTTSLFVNAAGLSGSHNRTFFGAFGTDLLADTKRAFFTHGSNAQNNGRRWTIREDTGFLRAEVTGASYKSSIGVTTGGLIGAGHTGNTFAGLQMYRDGVSYTNLTTSTMSLTTIDDVILLGKLHGNSTGTRSGVVGEVVYCWALLSLADRQKLEGYLAHKWGFADRLPVAHPYKTAAPTVDTGEPVTIDHYLDSGSSSAAIFAVEQFNSKLLHQRWAVLPNEFALAPSYTLVKQTFAAADVDFSTEANYQLVKLAYSQMDSEFLLDIRLKYVTGRIADSFGFIAGVQYELLQARYAAFAFTTDVDIDPALVKSRMFTSNVTYDVQIYPKFMWEAVPDLYHEIWTDPAAATTPIWRRLFP